MIESILRIAKGGGLRHKTTDYAQNVPFLPRAAIRAKQAIWPVLLGAALVCPAMLFVELFPITPDAHLGAVKSLSRPLFVVLTSIVIGPLLEEFVYRGLLLQLLRRYAPTWAAIVLSSAVFAATHFMKGIAVVVVAFVVGCLLAWMVGRTGSLYPAILCHTAFDFTGFVSSSMFGINHKIMEYAPGATVNHPLTELFPAWWIVVSMFMAVTASIMLARELARRGSRGRVGNGVSAMAA